MDVSSFDKSISKILSRYERASNIPAHKLSHSELNFIDPMTTTSLEDVLLHIIKNSPRVRVLYSEVGKNSKYKNLLTPIMNHMIKNGAAPKAEIINLITPKEMGTKYRTLMPFMLSKTMPSIELGGFRNEEGNSLWFAITGNNSDSFSCVGSAGDERKVSYMALWDKGYERINSDSKSLFEACRKDMGQGFSSKTVKDVALFIGGKITKEMSEDAAIQMLDKALLDIKDTRIPSPSNGNKKIVR